MIKNKIQEIEYVIFDIETTGFNLIEDQIIEIGAVKINGQGEVVEKFQKFVSLYKKESLPPKIIELTHIDDQMLHQEGKDIADVMEQFYEFFKDCVLVAQNTKFDMSFIDTYYLEEKSIFLPNLTLDTIDLAKKIYPNKQTYKLAKLIEYFEVEYDADAHHRADYDALITSKIFIKGMAKLIKEDNLVQFEQLIDIFNIEEASINQKRYLYTLLKNNNITLENKVYLSKFNASRQISILAQDK